MRMADYSCEIGVHHLIKQISSIKDEFGREFDSRREAADFIKGELSKSEIVDLFAETLGGSQDLQIDCRRLD